MTNENKKIPSRFAHWGVLLTGRKIIPPHPSTVEKTCFHSAVANALAAGTNHGFGAGENDWLGAEAYVNSML